MIFVLGMRGTGTTAVWKFINNHPAINPSLLFEPHELSFVLDVSHIGRYQSNSYVQSTLRAWKSGVYGGAKIAYNPGQISLRWQWIPEAFPGSKFVFLKRNTEDNYASLVSKDKGKIYGVPSLEQFSSYRRYLVDSFERYQARHPNYSIVLDYDEMLSEKDAEFNKVWDILGVERKSIANQLQRPKHQHG